jgi:hypothetical protein
MPSERHWELWASAALRHCQMRHWARGRLVTSTTANIDQWLMAKDGFRTNTALSWSLGNGLGSLGVLEFWSAQAGPFTRLAQSIRNKSDSVPNLGTVCAVDLHQRVAGFSSSSARAEPCSQQSCLSCPTSFSPTTRVLPWVSFEQTRRAGSPLLFCYRPATVTQ